MLTPPLTATLQEALGSSYRLERELGGGAMARVFLAEETALGRRVVIKVLPPELAEGLSPERFKREILLSARLHHPQIVPVLAAGDASGVPYYTMPYVAGESLRQRLSDRGRVPFRELVSILRDVARALAYAHHEGVVHRDIKPENVLIHAPLPGSDVTDSVVVADFGVAKALSSALTRGETGAGDGTHLTHLGMTIGTPTYMAPEQAVGEEIDHRADIYAFGVMGYELAVGAPPFIESSTQRLMVAHLTKTPPALAERLPELPRSFAEIVMRCLAKEAADRPQSMSEVLRVLDSLASFCETEPAHSPDLAPSPSPPGPSVAVLPFANLSADPDAEYFSDGVTEEVLNALTQVPGLRVAARTSAFAFKGKQLPLQTIAEQLNVRTILEGSVRRSGNRVRIGVQLVSASDGLHLWSERFDRELSDVFALQDEIARSIAMALGERLTSGERSASPSAVSGAGAPSDREEERPQRHARHGALNMTAYEQYLRGRFLFEQHDHRVMEALHCCESAGAIDPEFALAHAWTGIVYAALAAYRVVPSEQAFERARVSTERALALNPDLAEALTGRSMVALWHEWDIAKAESLARRAVAAAPGLGIAHEWLGWALLPARRFEEAEAEMRRALELDPLNNYTRVSVLFALMMAGKPAEVEAVAREGLSRTPNDAELHRLAGLAYVVNDDCERGLESLRRAYELQPAHPYTAGNLAWGLSLCGRREEAREIVAGMEPAARDGKTAAAIMSLALYPLGEHDAAIDWLEKSLQMREFWLVVLHVDPEFWSMHGDPRFHDIVRRIGVAP